MAGSVNGIVSQGQTAGSCSWCQSPLPAESQFCPNCGEPVTETSRAVTVAVAAAAAPTVAIERGGRLCIAGDLRRSLLESARRELGRQGEDTLRDITEQALSLPLEEITYAELPHLFIAVHQDAPVRAGREPAGDLARALEGLHADMEAEMRRRLLDGFTATMGSVAEPFLVNVCAGIDLDFARLTLPQLPLLAAAVERDGAIFGQPVAASLGAAVESMHSAPDAPDRLIAVATEHVGPEGEALIGELCRGRLGKDLAEIDIEQILPLAAAVEEDGPARIGAQRTAAFITAARFAVVNPSDSPQAPLVRVVNREMGPAGEVFLRRSCNRNGLPYEAICYEHLPWLAEVLRQEATPLLGAAGADRLAQDVQRLQAERA